MTELSQLARLAKPVPAKYVMKAPQGKYGDYIGHDVITAILLTIVGPYSFKVEQIVYGPEGLVEGVTASLSCTIDGRDVTVTEIGDCEKPTNWKSQGARMKDAASDALKRCAMRLGLGLALWTKGDYFLFAQLEKSSLADGSGRAPESANDGGAVTSPHVRPRTREGADA